jgi:hypothetical protein
MDVFHLTQQSNCWAMVMRPVVLPHFIGSPPFEVDVGEGVYGAFHGQQSRITGHENSVDIIGLLQQNRFLHEDIFSGA